MPTSEPVADTSQVRERPFWLDQRLSGWWCAFAWLVATGIFIGLVRILGGPTESDAAESLYSTWAVAHGHLSCVYPPTSTVHFPALARPGPFIAPLWPLFSGGVAAITRIGHGVAFPATSAIGTHCSTATVALYHWSAKSGAVLPTVRIGYLSWGVLIAGLVALLRASGRGRCGWEPAALALVACIPPLWMPLVQDYHPQDIVAMGLSLGALACARRSWWIWAGVLIALAVSSQQFALLVAAPLVVLAQGNRRIRFVGAAVITTALVTLPLIGLSSGRAVSAVLLGSSSAPSFGGTVLWEMHLHGSLLVGASRVFPIVLAILLAWWVQRRLGPVLLEPVPLLALVATSLSLRLVFEETLFGYYFMALAVALVLLDIAGGHIRWQLVAWLALVTLTFNPVPSGLFVSNSQSWGIQAREVLPVLGIVVGLLFIGFDAARRTVRWYLVAWVAFVALAFAKPPWAGLPLRQALPTWLIQVVLVTSGVALAVAPLISLGREHAESNPRLTVGARHG